MTLDLSQSWLAQAGTGPGRGTMMVAGFVAIVTGAIALATTIMAPAAALPLTYIARVLTAIGGLFLALPLFLASLSEDKWSNSVRIAGLVIGFLILALTLIRT
jgi:hypothetical protein